MAKIINDKYYTPIDLAKYCIDKTYEIIGKENIREIIEPSAGNGSFSNQIENCIAYDIEPECDGIIKQDYLELELEYKKGRLVIGNPPFGEKNILSMKFFKKSIVMTDYISFILPISQLNNNQQMYEFDLIYSEDLGRTNYSDIDIHCCLNIYKRPIKLHSQPTKYKLKDISMKECRKARNQFLPSDFSYDVAICTWGSVGANVEYQGQYHQELYIKINNEYLKSKAIEVLNSADWCSIYSMTKSPRLAQWQVCKYLKEQIPELE